MINRLDGGPSGRHLCPERLGFIRKVLATPRIEPRPVGVSRFAARALAKSAEKIPVATAGDFTGGDPSPARAREVTGNGYFARAREVTGQRSAARCEQRTARAGARSHRKSSLARAREVSGDAWVGALYPPVPL